MLGMTDWGVASAYLLSLATTIFCIGYAIWSGRKTTG